MAIEMEIPNDIMKYKKGFIGNFSMRQTILLGVGVLIDYNVSKILRGFNVSFDTMLPILVVLIIPFLAFGWVQLYGLPLEKFLKVAFVSMFLSPQKRLYKTKNAFQAASENFNAKIKKKSSAGSKKFYK